MCANLQVQPLGNQYDSLPHVNFGFLPNLLDFHSNGLHLLGLEVSPFAKCHLFVLFLLLHHRKVD